MTTRILLIANTLPPKDISGVGEQVVQLAAGLNQRGLEVEILGRGPGGARGPKLLFPLTIVPAVLWRLWKFRPQVVQVHESDGALAALSTVFLRLFLRPRPILVALQQVSYVQEIRAVRPLKDGGTILAEPGAEELRFRRFKGRLQVFLGRLSARLADRVLAPSRVTAKELEEDYGVSGVRVLPNVTGGLEVLYEAPPVGGEGDGFLLFVGRLRLRKGVEVLLQALREIRAELPSARLLIAGDGEHRGALEERVKSLGLEENAVFLGRCSAGQVRGLMARASALVVPSIYEGMPLVVLEAMEMGTPVVASAVSGIPEVVDQETGWLVPAEDSAALAEALREVLTRPKEAQQRGAAGRRRLEQRFRPPQAAQLWHDLILGAGTDEIEESSE